MNIYEPYTYLIGWSQLNTWYYGVRYAKKANPKDFWTTYFTSSKLVKEFRIKHGEPDVRKIRKTFTSAEKALEWEQRLLRKADIVKKKEWLNQQIHGFETRFKGHTKESRLKLSKAWNIRRLTPVSEETKAKMRKPKIKPSDFSEKCRQNRLGKPFPGGGKTNKRKIVNGDQSLWIHKDDPIPKGWSRPTRRSNK
jgi:hypothetical protein